MRLIGVFIASAYSLYYLVTYRTFHFIDTVDLIFHEAGHSTFLSPLFGNFIHVLMGSGFQILLPVAIAGYFFYTKQRLSGAICLMWAGMNFLNVSVYAGDAVTMQLPLLGGDSSMHDWHYLLGATSLLNATPIVAGIIYGMGVLTMLAGIALAFVFA